MKYDEFLGYLERVDGSEPRRGFEPSRKSAEDPEWVADYVHEWLTARRAQQLRSET
jgi:hypothetical protein